MQILQNVLNKLFRETGFAQNLIEINTEDSRGVNESENGTGLIHGVTRQRLCHSHSHHVAIKRHASFPFQKDCAGTQAANAAS